MIDCTGRQFERESIWKSLDPNVFVILPCRSPLLLAQVLVLPLVACDRLSRL